MALSEATLKGLIKAATISALSSTFGGLKTGLLASEQAGIDSSWDSIADALAQGDSDGTVPHIQNDAVVLPTALLDSLSGAVTGTGEVN